MSRFIKLYDQILRWEWYKNPNTFRLFIHLLLRANYKDMKFEGRIIKRGQLVTSLPSLAAETGLSVQSIRTAINHLKSTGEITDTSTSQYRVITISNYDQYQDSDRQINRQSTGDQQAINRPSTASIESIERIEGIEDSLSEPSAFTKPTRDDIRRYCIQRRNDIDWDRFYEYYEAKGWTIGGEVMRDWKPVVRMWETTERNVSAE